MLLHVEFEIFDTIYKYEDVQRVRKAAAALLEHVQKSGRVLHGGVFADTRGFFLQIDVDTADQIFELIAPWANDMAHIRIRPIMSIDKFPELMQTISGRDIR